MTRNKSDIFSFDQGLSFNQKKNGKFSQQCATHIDAVFRPFLVDNSIAEKILESFLKGKKSYSDMTLGG